MRVLCHAQHLTGVGHFVRMHLVAQGLAPGHDVYLVDGGRPVPRPESAAEPRRLALPPLIRGPDGGLRGSDGDPPTPVLARRARLLAEAVEAIRPDALLVDHFPFSKWELEDEISAAIAAARRANPAVRVVCSLRDIAARTRHEATDDAAYASIVLERLGQGFDAVLVHSDPAFVRLEEQFPRASEIPVPVTYTGFVAESPAESPAPTGPGRVVLSAGGSTAAAFLAAGVLAFRRLARSVGEGPICLNAFPGPGTGPGVRASLEVAAGDDASVQVHRFSPAFTGWLHGATLSISRAGYNTSVALLRSRVPAVVVPDPRLSDQGPRAERLERAGLAVTVEPAGPGASPDVGALHAAMQAALAAPPPRHDFDLEGVGATRRYLEGL